MPSRRGCSALLPRWYQRDPDARKTDAGEERRDSFLRGLRSNTKVPNPTFRSLGLILLTSAVTWLIGSFANSPEMRSVWTDCTPLSHASKLPLLSSGGWATGADEGPYSELCREQLEGFDWNAIPEYSGFGPENPEPPMPVCYKGHLIESLRSSSRLDIIRWLRSAISTSGEGPYRTGRTFTTSGDLILANLSTERARDRNGVRWNSRSGAYRPFFMKKDNADRSCTSRDDENPYLVPATVQANSEPDIPRAVEAQKVRNEEGVMPEDWYWKYHMRFMESEQKPN